MTQGNKITAHYRREGPLSERILELVRTHRGEIGGPLCAPDLARFDQFHMGGPRSTAHLAKLAHPRAGDLVLDIGAGIGGPARQLVQNYEVTVVALDLTESFCIDAAALSQAVGMKRAVLPCCSDATRLPFRDDSFDIVWTQHAAMNISNKVGLYEEVARVLKPGSLFALHDIMAGPAGPPYYPTPWAGSEQQSALLPPEDVRQLIRASGLVEVQWNDETDALLEAQRAEREARKDAPPDPGPHLLYPGFLDLARNLQRSLREDRARVVTALFRKGTL